MDCENILKSLRDEFKSIRNELRKQEDFVEQLQQTMLYKPKNVEGSFVNRVLCIYENKMSNAMSKALTEKRLEIAQYAFDGLLVYNIHGEDLLKYVEDYLNTTFPDLNLTLTIKPPSRVITKEYLENLEKLKRNMKRMSIKSVNLKKTHCKILNKAFFIKETNSN